MNWACWFYGCDRQWITNIPSPGRLERVGAGDGDTHTPPPPMVRGLYQCTRCKTVEIGGRK